MDNVHVFVSTGRFKSVEEMREFIDETYTEDGDGIPSVFINEVGLDDYEPGCIEAYCSKNGDLVPHFDLLAGASYADQWLPQLDGSQLADASICVFSPNVVSRPHDCSLEYLGSFEYRVVHPEWLQRIIRGDPAGEESK